eukprot:scaffold13578_cov173-Alexandrium_tamarense.AAC.10
MLAMELMKLMMDVAGRYPDSPPPSSSPLHPHSVKACRLLPPLCQPYRHPSTDPSIQMTSRKKLKGKQRRAAATLELPAAQG